MGFSHELSRHPGRLQLGTAFLCALDGQRAVRAVCKLGERAVAVMDAAPGLLAESDRYRLLARHATVALAAAFVAAFDAHNVAHARGLAAAACFWFT